MPKNWRWIAEFGCGKNLKKGAHYSFVFSFQQIILPMANLGKTALNCQNRNVQAAVALVFFDEELVYALCFIFFSLRPLDPLLFCISFRLKVTKNVEF